MDEHGDCQRFRKLITLTCHRALEACNVSVLLRLIRGGILPDLKELHCNFDGLKSLSDYGCPNDQLDRLCVGLLKIQCQNDPELYPIDIYVQSAPLREDIYKRHRFAPSPLDIQNQDAKLSTLAFRKHMLQRFTSIIHFDFSSFCYTPRAFARRNLRIFFSHRFPCLQEIELNGKASVRPTSMDSFKLFLQTQRSVSKLTFIHSGFESGFFFYVLPGLSCLTDSLVVLKIFEQLQLQQLTFFSLAFLLNFRHLRFFGTNLLDRRAICTEIDPFALPRSFTFEFNFGVTLCETDNPDYHKAIIRKVEQNQFQLTLQEKKPSDVLGSFKTHDLGILNLNQLKDKLNHDPTCLRLLNHSFDDRFLMSAGQESAREASHTGQAFIQLNQPQIPDNLTAAPVNEEIQAPIHKYFKLKTRRPQN